VKLANKQTNKQTKEERRKLTYILEIFKVPKLEKNFRLFSDIKQHMVKRSLD